MSAVPPSYTPITSQAPAYAAPSAVAGGGSDPLPEYDGSNAPPSAFVHAPGIDEKLPNHFKINSQYAKAQVLPSDLQAHLVLLGAFC
ncbi:hypothetical protein FRC01_001880 [Tulasnella sp. 417]|nr:hypothetical protein FRC01_001880 [Tulasnella sp. 417]